MSTLRDTIHRGFIKDCLGELRRKSTDEDLLVIAKEWARETYGTTDGRWFYHHNTLIPKGSPYPPDLLAGPDEVRIATQEYLKCLLERRARHSVHIKPKLDTIVSNAGGALNELGEAVDHCLFLRHHSPFGIRPKVPEKNELGEATGFKWAWTIPPDCPFEMLLSDLSTTSLRIEDRESIPSVPGHPSSDTYCLQDDQEREHAWICDRRVLRVAEDQYLERTHEYWSRLNENELRLCEEEFLRVPSKNDLLLIAVDWAHMVWVTEDGETYYLRHMHTDMPNSGALRVRKAEIRKGVKGYLRGLVERRKFHTAFIAPKIRAVMARMGVSSHDKIEQCLFLRTHSPLGIEARIPLRGPDGSVKFQYVWEPYRAPFLHNLIMGTPFEDVDFGP
ncbi:hypothetical protein DFP72DRAFT_1060456 [Ephemerocybe angulata]|uniref:Uncharacterized protein n=1 Tax=Ephemerocybe angulata TaxID=980116 RepID=A0A8H6IF90_9AGAR|nr:hypothetical protein DFP72DRAFT_1060456 [Tulosesus angulatus]